MTYHETLESLPPGSKLRYKLIKTSMTSQKSMFITIIGTIVVLTLFMFGKIESSNPLYIIICIIVPFVLFGIYDLVFKQLVDHGFVEFNSDTIHIKQVGKKIQVVDLKDVTIVEKELDHLNSDQVDKYVKFDRYDPNTAYLVRVVIYTLDGSVVQFHAENQPLHFRSKNRLNEITELLKTFIQKGEIQPLLTALLKC